MAKANILVTLTSLTLFAASTTSSYSGPFLLWGTENLSKLKIPSLQAIDDKDLRDIYASATSVVIFVRNSTTSLTKENFPRLSEIVKSTESLYLPQDQLSSDPVEYNVNSKIIFLTGPVEQQDDEIANIFKSAQINSDTGKVLGILATQHERVITKRAITYKEPVTVFLAPNKGMLAIYNPIYLRNQINSTHTDVFRLENGKVTSMENQETFKLIIDFTSPENIQVGFVFPIASGYWSLTQAEIKFRETTNLLEATKNIPTAPMNFSYVCGDILVFKKETWSLTLSRYQVQPRLQSIPWFSRSQDCVGVTSPGIISGTFVVAILAFVLTIAITAILDIKTPNRFENRNSKPLTFTVQE